MKREPSPARGIVWAVPMGLLCWFALAAFALGVG